MLRSFFSTMNVFVVCCCNNCRVRGCTHGPMGSKMSGRVCDLLLDKPCCTVRVSPVARQVQTSVVPIILGVDVAPRINRLLDACQISLFSAPVGVVVSERGGLGELWGGGTGCG